VVEATVGEVGVVEGARQGTKPLATAGEGGSRGNSLVRLGEWICGGGLDVESRGCGGRKPSPRSHLMSLVGPQPKWKRQATPHLPQCKAQHPIYHQTRSNAPINHQTRLIHDFAISFLYCCGFNCKRIIIFIDNSFFNIYLRHFLALRRAA
jgi:hypothetical protein